MKRIKIFAVVMGIVIIAMIMALYNNNLSVKVRRQISLGQKYLEEMNYEQAVVVFEIAIEIDPMSVEAYLGLADAHVGLGDAKKALTVLEEGYERTQDKRLLMKRKQIGYIEFDFTAEDFTIMGHSVLEGDQFERIMRENNIPVVYADNTGTWVRSYNEIEGVVKNERKTISLEYIKEHHDVKGNGIVYASEIYCVWNTGNVGIVMVEGLKSLDNYIDSILYLGDSIEMASEILKVTEIMEKGKITDDNLYEFESNLGKGIYYESHTADSGEYYVEFENWSIRISYQEENNLIDFISITSH